MQHRISSVPDISVVLAIRNDEETVGHQVRGLVAHLRGLGRTFEIVAVNDGSRDNSLSLLRLLAPQIAELRVITSNLGGRAFLRGTSESRGAVVVLLEAGRTVSWAPLGWALSRLEAGREAVIVRASGPGLLFEHLFERRARDLGIDIVGTRPRSAAPLLLRPVLRFLAA
jgi:hypothetical protein